MIRPMLVAEAHLVNGSVLDSIPVSAEALARLQRDGLAGRELIHALITDDWGAPPAFVKISGTTERGEVVSLVIHYD